MVKKFTIPFASQGDANDIPDALQVDGKVSFTQGFGYDYERPYDDPQAKDIAREDMNGLFKAITSAVGELQTLGASEWSSAISYPKGAIVYYEKDLYISQVDDNQNTPPQNWVSITSIANDSLKKAANLSDLTNKTTARNNLGLGSSATLNKTDVLGTSTSLVATQKLVNDTKINLENSKQDKLTFVGDGPEVMKTGAFGLGASAKSLLTHSEAEKYNSGFFTTGGETNFFGTASAAIAAVGYRSFIFSASGTQAAIKTREPGSVYDKRFDLYHTANTTVDRSGFLRASGSANALTTSDVTQSLGTSTTLVASQALVNSVSKQASEHGLGYGQKWVDVTSQRVADTTYTNNTGKPIMVSASLDGGKDFARIYVDDVQVGHQWGDSGFLTAIVPPRSKYRVSNRGVVIWAELR